MNIKTKIFIDENIPLLPEALSACVEIVCFKGRELTNSALIKSGAEALFVRSTTKVNRELLRNTGVRFVGTATSGTDHIDLAYIDENNIVFASAPGSNANSVAEYLVFAILKWAFSAGADLRDVVLGVVGYGNVGRIAARYGALMGIKTLINDPPLKEAGFSFPAEYQYLELDELCKRADILTNHVPLTTDGRYPTKNLIGADMLSLLRGGSLLIHTSRGGVVDEAPLLERIQGDSLYAAIDVWTGEPLINRPLADAATPASPHIAGYSRDGKLRGALMMAEAFRDFSGMAPDLSIIENETTAYNPMAKEKFQDYGPLYKALKESRKLDEDTEKLTGILGLSRKERAAAFDLLRKNYPLRREIL